jgi:signal transduction histidine kinase
MRSSDVLELGRQGRTIDGTEPVDLGDAARTAWRNVDTRTATQTLEAEATLHADEERFVRLLENLFRNVVEHAGEDATVRIGATEDGFYVADDGPGIPPDEREQVFETGYTTADDGTGFGLAIVAEIAEAHGWTVGVGDRDAPDAPDERSESDDPSGGARFEFTGVERA